MLSLMKKGSIICDLAVEQGGNCIYSESGKVVEKFGIKILGYYVGFLVTQRMLSMYKKRIKNDFI